MIRIPGSDPDNLYLDQKLCRKGIFVIHKKFSKFFLCSLFIFSALDFLPFADYRTVPTIENGKKIEKTLFSCTRAKILNCKIAINSTLCRAGSRIRILQSDPDFDKAQIQIRNKLGEEEGGSVPDPDKKSF